MAVDGVVGGRWQGASSDPDTGAVGSQGGGSEGAHLADLSRQIGASGDVDRAVAHVQRFPTERDNVERALVASGQMHALSQLAGVLDSGSGQPSSTDGTGAMLTKDPHTCSAPLAQAEKEWQDKGFLGRLAAETDGWGNSPDVARARLFERECNRLPDRIPAATLDAHWARLNAYTTGQAPMAPEQAVRLRSEAALLEDVYRPGPRIEAPMTPAETTWLQERNLRAGNDLGIALLGPLFGAPGAATRLLGGSESQVAAANEVGATVMDMATAHLGAVELGRQSGFRPGEVVHEPGNAGPREPEAGGRPRPETSLGTSAAADALGAVRPDLSTLEPLEHQQLVTAQAHQWDTLREQRDLIPQKSGVYIFSRTPGDITDNALGVLYVGKADNLRSRLPAYLADPRTTPLMSSKRPGEASSALKHPGKAQLMVQLQQDLASGGESHIWVRWIETDQPKALEDKLIRAYQPAFNTAGVDW
jgi:hypothetical protein